MTYQDLKTLLDYHYWARDRVLEAVEPLTDEQLARDLGNSFPSVRETLVHLLFAEWVWHARWTGHSPTEKPTAEGFSDVPAIRAEWVRLEGEVRGFLDSLGEEGIHRTFGYTMMNGASYVSVYGDTLQHLVNHGSYHRGQLTTMLRQLGAGPAKGMDLIQFYRERPAAE